jgi:hypothetical protein
LLELKTQGYGGAGAEDSQRLRDNDRGVNRRIHWRIDRRIHRRGNGGINRRIGRNGEFHHRRIDDNGRRRLYRGETRGKGFKSGRFFDVGVDNQVARAVAFTGR